jgi:hypothetical protein
MERYLVMDIEKEWFRNPPKPFNMQLETLIQDFITRFPRDKRDRVFTFCEEANSIEEAWQRAVASKDKNGKHHNHQSKIFKECYANFYDSCKEFIFGKEYSNFDELHDGIEKLKPSGIGPVFVYDAATRIAAYLKMEPKSIYLHAGVIEGLNALGIITKGKKRLVRTEIPDALNILKADEIEDFLCTYRYVLNQTKLLQGI